MSRPAAIALLMALLGTGACDSDPKFQQYQNAGRELYKANCQNCHKQDGKGLGLLIPPLAGSDFLKNKDNVACIIKNGRSGPITVNGKIYDQPMPANPKLTDLEIASIMTYIYNEWGGQEGLIGVKEVSRSLDRCAEE